MTVILGGLNDVRLRRVGAAPDFHELRRPQRTFKIFKKIVDSPGRNRRLPAAACCRVLSAVHGDAIHPIVYTLPGRGILQDRAATGRSP